MLSASGRVLAVSAVVATVLTAGDASARMIRRSCRDGTDRAGGSTRSLVACDVGAACDGVCAFDIPVCGPESCATETLTVPAGSTRRERVAVSAGAAPATLVLRCRATTRATGCIAVTTTSYTTTTGGSTTTGTPRPPGMTTTTTRVRPAHASTTSSTTMATTSSTTSSTSTTIVIPSRISCFGDSDCDGLATACAVGFCADSGFCAQLCVCVTADFAPTCSVDAAKACLTAGECFGSDPTDPACRVCYLNHCRAELLPECFPAPPGQSGSSFTVDFGVGFDGAFTVGGGFGSTP